MNRSRGTAGIRQGIRKWATPLLLCVVLYMGLFETRREEDTNRLVFGTQGIMACLSEGRLIACAPTHETAEFAPLQYLPALLMEAAGIPPLRAGRMLGYLSAILFLLMFRTLTRHLAETSSGETAVLGRIALLTSPFLWYARSSFGETLAAWVTLHFVIAATRSRTSGWKVAGWFFLAGLSKETAFPFLCLLGWAALPSRARIFPILGGTALSLLVNSVFNLFRYGEWSNVVNLQPLYRVPDLSTQASSFFGIWFSPSAGLLFFWPAFFALTLFGVVASLRKPANPWLAPSVLLTLAGLTAGFSLWYAPFGWNGWGPRLMLPWLPAILFLVLLHPCWRTWPASILGRPRVFWGVFVFLAAVSAPQFVILFSQKALDHFFLWTSHGFERPIMIQEDAQHYFRSIRQMTWTWRSPLLELYRLSVTSWLILPAMLFGAMVFAELSRLRDAARRRGA